MTRLAPVVIGICLLSCSTEPDRTIVVGSKNFTESVILGEIVAQRLEAAGCDVEHKQNLGGTLVCDMAMESGALDAYVEYSGTALTSILHRPSSPDREEVNRTIFAQYAEKGLVWGPSLGFNNTFAMLVRQSDADDLGLRAVSDLTKVADRFRPGFGYEFTERPDGWPGLQQAYGFTFQEPPRVMDLGLTYKALAAGEVDLIAGNSTDGLIDSLQLRHLEDDAGYFPPYDAAIVYREDIGDKCVDARAALQTLEGTLDDQTMRRLNFAVDGDKRSVADVAAGFLAALDENP